MVFEIEEVNNLANSLNFKPVPNYRVSGAIYEQIRNKILNGELKPNDRLPSERTLINIFQRSRPTIREALRMLERSGLIETIPGSGGAVIKEVTSSIVQQPLESMILLKCISLIELYEFRIVNETAYIQWAAERRTEDDIKNMRSIIKQMQSCKNDWNIILKCDSDFHRAIVEAGRNEMAKIVLEVISQPILEIFLKEFAKLTKEQLNNHCKRILSENEAMLEMIIKQDEENARRLMVEHLNKFKHLMKDDK